MTTMLTLPMTVETSTTYLHGHVLEQLRALPDQSVHCIVTSPPYYGLRSYGTAPQIWGGQADCAHEWDAVVKPATSGTLAQCLIEGSVGTMEACATRLPQESATCARCGAWRGHLGLEPDYRMFIRHLVEDVFGACWRVLRDDGTLWFNMGDSYATGAGNAILPGGGSQGDAFCGYRGSRGGSPKQAQVGRAIGPEVQPNRLPQPGLKSKDLMGMPWRIAFALQDAGWYLRRDIIWAKKSPMPESCRDRCTTGHEYLFHLSKGARYYYDRLAIAERVSGNAHGRGDGVNPKAVSGWDTGAGNHDTVRHNHGGRSPQQPRQNASYSASIVYTVSTRNKRSVWTVASQPFDLEMCRVCRVIYTGRDYSALPRDGHDDHAPRVCRCGASDWVSHFASYPEALVEPCVLAGTSAAGCCPACGAPWRRVIEQVKGDVNPSAKGSSFQDGKTAAPRDVLSTVGRGERTVSEATIGWASTCTCDAGDPVPCTVLDPFAGSCRSAVVAKRHGRDSIMVDLNADYLALGRYQVDHAPAAVHEPVTPASATAGVLQGVMEELEEML